MTAPYSHPVAVPRRVTPGSITLARVAGVVNLLLGLLASVFLGFLALFGLTWPREDGSGPPLDAYAVAAVFALALAAIITMGCLTARLRPGADGIRIALVMIESTVVAVVVVALAAARGELEGLLTAPTLYVACGVARVVALLQPSARFWCRASARVTS